MGPWHLVHAVNSPLAARAWELQLKVYFVACFTERILHSCMCVVRVCGYEHPCLCLWLVDIWDLPLLLHNNF